MFNKLTFKNILSIVACSEDMVLSMGYLLKAGCVPQERENGWLCTTGERDLGFMNSIMIDCITFALLSPSSPTFFPSISKSDC